MRSFVARSGVAAATLAITTLAFTACGDLFHGTDWSSKCDADPNAPGCADATAAGGSHATGSGAGPGSGGGSGGTTLSGGGGNGGGPCTGKQTRCGNACVDTTSDPEHCGSCADACDPSQGCNASKCVYRRSCKQIHDEDPGAPSGVYTIDPDSAGAAMPFQVYCDMTTQGGGLTLVLKLSGGDFCFGSAHWSDDMPLNQASTLDPTLPAAGDPDAKSQAFYQLADATQLLFVTALGSVTTSFAGSSTPKLLMTTQAVPFSSYPNRAAWRTAFGHDRNQAPVFMRGGLVETAGNTCRLNPGVTPSGCGQPCVFCYQASDGDCCGCDATLNDTNSGIGDNLAYCGAGQANCSAAGLFSNPSGVAIVWAR